MCNDGDLDRLLRERVPCRRPTGSSVPASTALSTSTTLPPFRRPTREFPGAVTLADPLRELKLAQASVMAPRARVPHRGSRPGLAARAPDLCATVAQTVALRRS